MSMSTDEFLARLKETPRRWALSGDMIRCSRIIGGFVCRCCPITSLDPRGAGPCDFWLAAAAMLGLDPGDRDAIMEAADNDGGHDSALRLALLDACGLSDRVAR